MTEEKEPETGWSYAADYLFSKKSWPRRNSKRTRGTRTTKMSNGTDSLLKKKSRQRARTMNCTRAYGKEKCTSFASRTHTNVHCDLRFLTRGSPLSGLSRQQILAQWYALSILASDGCSSCFCRTTSQSRNPLWRDSWFLVWFNASTMQVRAMTMT